MTNLLSRLERLEREHPAARQRFIWIEPDETQEQVLGRAAAMGSDEIPIFVGWSRE
jgi:hypothetical protein